MSGPGLPLSPPPRFALEVMAAFVHGSPTPVAAPAPMDWTWIAELTRRHHLGPLFKSALTRAGVPPDLYAEWQAEERSAFAWNTRAVLAALKLIALLGEAGIPVTAMRGLVLAHTAYPAPVLRYMADVDLLIRPADVEATARALARQGLEPVKRLRSQLVYQVSDVMFELHYSILTPKRYRAALVAADFVNARQTFTLPEGVIPCLPREQELIAVIAHAFIHHELTGFIPLLDAALIARDPKLDWQYVAQWSRTAGLERMFHFSLAFVNRLFNLGREPELLRVFPRPLPPNTDKITEAYLARLLGLDRPRFYLRRLRHRFSVAESPATWLRQLLRLFARDEFSKLRRSLRARVRPRP